MTEKIMQRDYSIRQPYINKAKRLNWVDFDYDNMYPQRALDLAKSSPLQSAILANKLKYALGAGLADYKASIYTPNLTETWEGLLTKLMTDYVYLEAYAVQVILNENGQTFSFYHVPVEQVRFENFNENNQIEYAYLSTNWQYATGKNVVKIKMFGTETPKKGERYLIYKKKYQPGNYYYATPEWMTAANWVAADAALSTYYLNYIKNNFSSNLAVKYPTEPATEEKKAEIYENLRQCFGGEQAAGNILLLFGENEVLPEIENIEAVNADLYNAVTEVVMRYIISANRLTSPTLAGVQATAGLSSQSEEIIAAYTLYNLTVISECRNFVMNGINDLLQLNGYPRCLTIMDYDYRKEFEGQTASNDKVESEAINADENNVEKSE